MFITFNPMSADVIVDAFDDLLIKTFLTILFQFSMDAIIEVHLDELSESLRQPYEFVKNALECLQEKQIINIYDEFPSVNEICNDGFTDRPDFSSAFKNFNFLHISKEKNGEKECPSDGSNSI
jgi:hypothetical protein